ncbi:MAG: type I glutamate--ammonia ligase [Clostridia bacterium]|nr:type I glutamate--ammonia ligase [Clostridia bacterium]
MAKTVQDILSMIKENDIKMVDFKMVDINGQYRHVTIPAENFSEDTMKNGIGFDASNYGYAVVEKSDMVFIPDPDTAVIDPFCQIATLSMTGNAMIIDTPENRPLAQYPRNIVLAAEQYMKDLGIADEMYILPEFEFYLFDQVGWEVQGNSIGVSLDTKQSYWNSAVEGRGVVVPKQKNYHIAKPFDDTYECRSEMCLHMKDAGIEINYHHPEVAASGQFEIEPQLGKMSHMADATMWIKYIIHNTALKYGKSATFMPKPVYGEAGNGMHVHMLLKKDGKPVFAGNDDDYARLSKEAHWFMGGLLKHIASLCAITNPSTNSFKRLVPGFEAPVTVGYATSNRSAVIRIPAYAKTPDKRRFELRNPDATCNPYFCYAAILMAGLDGIKNQIDPHENGWGPYDMNLYHLSDEEKAKLHHLPTSLDQALDALEQDHDYLTAGGVFPEALLKNFIKAKRAECSEMAKIPHPAEFDKYYNL